MTHKWARVVVYRGGRTGGQEKGGQKRVLDYGCCSLFSTIFQVTSQASFTAYAGAIFLVITQASFTAACQILPSG